MLLVEETTSFILDRNVEILLMHLSSRLVAEIVSERFYSN